MVTGNVRAASSKLRRTSLPVKPRPSHRSAPRSCATPIRQGAAARADMGLGAASGGEKDPGPSVAEEPGAAVAAEKDPGEAARADNAPGAAAQAG